MIVGFVVVIGTLIIWMPRLADPQGPAWPTVMATAGLWFLGLMVAGFAPPMTILAPLLFFGLPLLLVAARRAIPQLRVINAIIPAYVLGLALSFVLPGSEQLAAVQDGVSSATVVLSIPLMLFAVDIRRWFRAGTEALVSLAIALVSVTVAITIGHVAFRTALPESAVVGGLLMGVYTGGTPNLAALRLALDVETSLYLTVHTVDLMVSAIYILIVISFGRGVMRRFGTRAGTRAVSRGSVPPADSVGPATGQAHAEELDFNMIVTPGNRRAGIAALAAALVVVILGVGISFLVPPEHRTVVTILALTTIALAATLLPGIQRLTTSFKIGEFFILVFTVTVGSMAEVERILSASPVIIAYMTVVVFGSLTLHFLLATMFRIRTGTILATSVSAVCSPPFVGMLAPIVRDPQIIAAGITTGIIGYAVGTYLGVFTAWILTLL